MSLLPDDRVRADARERLAEYLWLRDALTPSPQIWRALGPEHRRRWYEEADRVLLMVTEPG